MSNKTLDYFKFPSWKAKLYFSLLLYLFWADINSTAKKNVYLNVDIYKQTLLTLEFEYIAPHEIASPA